MLRKLTASLPEEDIEVVSMVTLTDLGKFDIAVVDSSTEKAAETCSYIRNVWYIPVVLMVRRRQKDWQRFQSIDTDAYITEDASSAELLARIRAIVRRRSK